MKLKEEIKSPANLTLIYEILTSGLRKLLVENRTQELNRLHEKMIEISTIIVLHSLRNDIKFKGKYKMVEALLTNKPMFLTDY